MAEKQEVLGKQEVLKVMVSSTIVDLPKHREQVRDACLRQGMFPVMMENLPASDSEAISKSLELVDSARIYVGVYAHRYGYMPKENNPRQISVTEMEYDRAVERGIPRLIFIMDKTHPITIDDVEQGEGAVKLKAFLVRVKTDNIVNFFKSPEDLRAHVINSLSHIRATAPNLSVDPQQSESELVSKISALPQELHPVSDIPAPPESYVAHPYTLLQSHRLVGRRKELNLLTDWVTKSDAELYSAHILSFVAIGGMGKSALTWKWFNDVAPEEMKTLAGRMWWSFYESDATFENFVMRALAYVSKRSMDEVRQISLSDREGQLLNALKREPFLIVLDGLERVLIAYARMDAARLEDTEVGNQRNLRKTADPRIGQFLRKLAQVKSARILISTRLYPTELETEGGDPIPGTDRYDLESLPDDDAVELWRTLGAKGSRDILLPVFNTFGKHTLLIQALAGEVKKHYRPAPGDFEKWREENPQFDPAKFPDLKDRMSHVLEFALRGLSDKARNVLNVVAAFRMPAPYETLAALFIGEGKLCADQIELDQVLTELEDRGLVGWDKRANRYDLHPIVRSVVWSGLNGEVKKEVYTRLYAHFESLPTIDEEEVNNLEDLTPAIELYHTLIGMDRNEDAVTLFYKRLSNVMLYRLSASRQRVEMLEILFPDGPYGLPSLSIKDNQAFVLVSLALAYEHSGQPGRAVPLLRRHNAIYSEMGYDGNLSIGLHNLSNLLWVTGGLRESEGAVRRAIGIARGRKDLFGEAANLCLLGLALGGCGEIKESARALRRSLDLFIEQNHTQSEGLVNTYLVQKAIWSAEYAEALELAGRAWEIASSLRNERDFIRAARVQGEVALGLDALDRADERLYHALTRARAVNHVEEELPALIALAELHRRRGDGKAAREFLEDVWEYAERGPYPLIHADARNVLAQIERDAGNNDKAIEAATKAYELAWCDGPPYAYHWGLIKAQKHLEELGAPLPEMPPFDESKFEPMPEVEIDPEDEFHVGDSKEE